MFDFGFENHEEHQGGERPPVSTIQVIQIKEIEVRTTRNGDPYLNLNCIFTEFSWKCYGNIFFPKHDGDDEKYQKSCGRFMDTLLSFGIPKSLNLRKMTPEILAQILTGRYAQTNVGENDKGYPEPTWFRRLTAEQAAQYKQPPMPELNSQPSRSAPQERRGIRARRSGQARGQSQSAQAPRRSYGQRRDDRQSQYNDDDIPF